MNPLVNILLLTLLPGAVTLALFFRGRATGKISGEISKFKFELAGAPAVYLIVFAAQAYYLSNYRVISIVGQLHTQESQPLRLDSGDKNQIVSIRQHPRVSRVYPDGRFLVNAIINNNERRASITFESKYHGISTIHIDDLVADNASFLEKILGITYIKLKEPVVLEERGPSKDTLKKAREK